MNSQIGIILLYAGMQLPFAVFLIHGFVAKVPVDLDEAGIIDGCSPHPPLLLYCASAFKACAGYRNRAYLLKYLE